MSLKNKLMVLVCGALAVIAVLGLASTTRKHSVAVVASAVWGS
jgi:hypothetical protein